VENLDNILLKTGAIICTQLFFFSNVFSLILRIYLSISLGAALSLSQSQTMGHSQWHFYVLDSAPCVPASVCVSVCLPYHFCSGLFRSLCWPVPWSLTISMAY